MKTALTPRTALWLGLVLLLIGLPLGAPAQINSPFTGVSTPQPLLSVLPLVNVTPRHILDLFAHAYQWNGAGPQPGFVTGPLNIKGLYFLIPNERDNSLIVYATPEGTAQVRQIVTLLDLPARPAPRKGFAPAPAQP